MRRIVMMRGMSNLPDDRHAVGGTAAAPQADSLSGFGHAPYRRHDPEANAAISQQGVIRTYRRYAPIYDWLFGAVLEPGRRAATAAVRELNPGRLLEVGVGTGLTMHAYPAGCDFVGIDLCN